MPARPMWHHRSCITLSCSPSGQHHSQVTTKHKRARVPTCAPPTFITPLLLCPHCLLMLSTSTDVLRVFLWPLAIRLFCSRISHTLTSTSAHNEHCQFEPTWTADESLICLNEASLLNFVVPFRTQGVIMNVFFSFMLLNI